MVIHAVSALFTVWADPSLWSCYNSKIRSDLQAPLTQVEVQHQQSISLRWKYYATSAVERDCKNILCLKSQHWGLISLVGSQSSRFFTACQIAASNTGRRRSTPLGNVFLTAFLPRPWSQTWCILSVKAKQFSLGHKDVYWKEYQPLKFGHQKKIESRTQTRFI